MSDIPDQLVDLAWDAMHDSWHSTEPPRREEAIEWAFRFAETVRLFDTKNGAASA